MKIKLLWKFEIIINFNYLNLFIKIFTRKIYKIPTKYKYIKQYYKSIIKNIIYIIKSIIKVYLLFDKFNVVKRWLVKSEDTQELKHSK